MCGFAGLIAWDERSASRETLGRMSATIAHRGPDGEGYHIAGEAIRPTAAGGPRLPPAGDPRPRPAIEPALHRRRRLARLQRRDLQLPRAAKELTKLNPTYAWRTTGDTEVLLRAYDAGARMRRTLNGMFALRSGTSRKSPVPRADRMGQKAAVHRRSATAPQSRFASELDALRSLDWVDGPSTDEASGYPYCGYGYARRSFYAGDRRTLPCGFTAESARVGRMGHQRRYFRPGDAGRSACTDARRERPRARDGSGVAAARQRCAARVFSSPAASIPASIACRAARLRRPVQTFSASALTTPATTRAHTPSEVAKHLGTEHHEFRVTPRRRRRPPEARRGLRRALRRLLRPADPLPRPRDPQARQGRPQRRRRRRTLRRLRPLPRHAPRPAPARVAPLGPIGRTLLARDIRNRRSRSRPDGCSRHYALVPPQRYDAYVRLFDDATIYRPAQTMTTLPPPEIAASSGRTESLPQIAISSQPLATDRVTYLPDDLLTKVDRCLDAPRPGSPQPLHGPRTRPLRRRLTTDQLLKGGPKRMLREAFANDLPAWVFKRKKMGFAVPIGEWFRGELRPMLRDHLFASDSFARQHFNIESRRAARRGARAVQWSIIRSGSTPCSCSSFGGSSIGTEARAPNAQHRTRFSRRALRACARRRGSYDFTSQWRIV